MSVINSLIYSPPWCKCVVWMLVTHHGDIGRSSIWPSFDLSHTVSLGIKFFQSHFFLLSWRVYSSCSLASQCAMWNSVECQEWELRNNREISRGWGEAGRALHAAVHQGCGLLTGTGFSAAISHLSTRREQKCSDKITQIKYLGLYFTARCFNSIFINGFRKSCLCPFPSASLLCYSCSHENPSDTTPPSSLSQCEGVSL